MATIAVFDDDLAFLDRMRDALVGAGYRVVCAAGAGNPLALVLRERPDLVILDLWTAGESGGLRALRLIRDAPQSATTPVLICSADHAALRDYAADWWALGCETLAKPFDQDDLLARVARLAPTGGGAATSD